MTSAYLPIPSHALSGLVQEAHKLPLENIDKRSLIQFFLIKKGKGKHTGKHIFCSDLVWQLLFG